MTKNQLDQLKEHTIVVSDSGEVSEIKRLQPQDATTNPSLIYKAAKMSDYEKLIDDAVAYAKGDLALAMVRNQELLLVLHVDPWRELSSRRVYLIRSF